MHSNKICGKIHLFFSEFKFLLSIFTLQRNRSLAFVAFNKLAFNYTVYWTLDAILHVIISFMHIHYLHHMLSTLIHFINKPQKKKTHSLTKHTVDSLFFHFIFHMTHFNVSHTIFFSSNLIFYISWTTQLWTRNSFFFLFFLKLIASNKIANFFTNFGVFLPFQPSPYPSILTKQNFALKSIEIKSIKLFYVFN